MPEYNQQKIDFQIQEAEEKRETEERIAEEKREEKLLEEMQKKAEEDEKTQRLQTCLSMNISQYSSRWKSACESWKKEVDKQYKTCTSIWKNVNTDYAEYCKNTTPDYNVDSD